MRLTVRRGALLLGLLGMAACVDPQPALRPLPHPRFITIGGDDVAWAVSAVCDTKSFNLIYVVTKRADSIATAVVAGGCK